MAPSAERAALGDFLRSRREAMRPHDVGLAARPRSRTPGLRREDVAELCSMSVDYIARLERGDGPRPSQQMAAALARGLRLSLDERDHLFLLCGHRPAQREWRAQHVAPALLRVVDRLADTPAQVMGPLGQTLAQTAPAVALLGDQRRYEGPARSAVWRWFTDPGERSRYLPEDHELTGRVHVARLRSRAAEEGPGSAAAALVAGLRERSEEFAALWERQEVGVRWSEAKRFLHPEIGRLDLHCQTLLDPDQGQSLLVFTAAPGSQDQEKLDLLAVLGADHLPVW